MKWENGFCSDATTAQQFLCVVLHGFWTPGLAALFKQKFRSNLAVMGGEGAFRIQIEIKIVMEDRKICIPSSPQEC